MGIEELPLRDQDHLRSIHAILQKFGAKPVVHSRQSEMEWARRSFPHWKKTQLFPFFLAQQECTELIAPVYGDSFVIIWFSPDDAMNVDRFNTRKLYNAGYLPLGYDPAGNIIVLDTNSKEGLEICLYYFPGLSERIRDKYLYRTGRSLALFLEWVWNDPNAFVLCWDQHFS